MLLKFLSAIELVSALAVILFLVGFAPLAAVKYVAVYLIVKGGLFFLPMKNYVSLMDFFSGIYLLAVYFGAFYNPALIILIGAWMLQKALMGFF